MDYIIGSDFDDDKNLLQFKLRVHIPCALLVFMLFELFELWIKQFNVKVKEMMEVNGSLIIDEELICSVCQKNRATRYTGCCSNTICDSCYESNENCVICGVNQHHHMICDMSVEDEVFEVQQFLVMEKNGY